MTLFIFKYCLPALLGYTLFVGLAGRMNPLAKPHYPDERPSWLLGLWTGGSVATVLAVCLHQAYGMPLEAAQTLVKPTLMALAVLLPMGLIVYALNRRHIRIENTSTTDHDGQKLSTADALSSHIFDGFSAGPLDTEQDPNGHDSMDRSISNRELDAMDLPEKDSPLVATFLNSADLRVLDTHKLPAAINDDRENDDDEKTDPVVSADDPGDLLNTMRYEQRQFSTEELDATMSFDAAPASDAPLSAHSDKDADTCGPAATEGQATALAARAVGEAMTSLEARLMDEQTAHQETAKHLRITRKALALLESKSRDYESSKADSVIRLEEKLARSINRQSASDAEASHEKDKRVRGEATIVKLKQDLVKAKQEVRRSTAARAKALSTANKSIAFARQAVQARAQLEADLDQARETLQNRQSTISSLIRELEREKRRTQEEIATMAKQLVLHEKQLKARRSLEEVARSVENKLSSRLVKKVAKARPLISDM